VANICESRRKSQISRARGAEELEKGGDVAWKRGFGREGSWWRGERGEGKGGERRTRLCGRFRA
jgi:hypothetical protein